MLSIWINVTMVDNRKLIISHEHCLGNKHCHHDDILIHSYAQNWRLLRDRMAQIWRGKIYVQHFDADIIYFSTSRAFLTPKKPLIVKHAKLAINSDTTRFATAQKISASKERFWHPKYQPPLRPHPMQLGTCGVHVRCAMEQVPCLTLLTKNGEWTIMNDASW